MGGEEDDSTKPIQIRMRYFGQVQIAGHRVEQVQPTGLTKLTYTTQYVLRERCQLLY